MHFPIVVTSFSLLLFSFYFVRLFAHCFVFEGEGTFNLTQTKCKMEDGCLIKQYCIKVIKVCVCVCGGGGGGCGARGGGVRGVVHILNGIYRIVNHEWMFQDQNKSQTKN